YKTEHLKIYREMKKSMVGELLKPWYPAAIDTVYGGFLSSFSYDFTPVGNQDKMIVTQARHVWSNAKAAELFPSVKWYKTGAEVGYRFLKDKMWDKQYGGFYTYTDRQGNPKPGGFAPKEAYGNSFALYALAAYYQSTGDTSALNLAIKEFHGWKTIATTPFLRGITSTCNGMARRLSGPYPYRPRRSLAIKTKTLRYTCWSHLPNCTLFGPTAS